MNEGINMINVWIEVHFKFKVIDYEAWTLIEFDEVIWFFVGVSTKWIVIDGVLLSSFAHSFTLSHLLRYRSEPILLYDTSDVEAMHLKKRVSHTIYPFNHPTIDSCESLTHGSWFAWVGFMVLWVLSIFFSIRVNWN